MIGWTVVVLLVVSFNARMSIGGSATTGRETSAGASEGNDQTTRRSGVSSVCLDVVLNDTDCSGCLGGRNRRNAASHQQSHAAYDLVGQCSSHINSLSRAHRGALLPSLTRNTCCNYTQVAQ